MTDAEILDFAQAKYNMLLNHDKTFMFGEFQLQITSQLTATVKVDYGKIKEVRVKYPDMEYVKAIRPKKED